MECLYCHTSFNTFVYPDSQYYRVLDMGFELNELIEEQIQRDINETDTLCDSCLSILTRQLDQIQDPVAGSFDIGRCVCCNRLLHHQTHTLVAGVIYNEVAVRISPREIPPNGQICHACWMAVRRHIAHQEETNRRLEAPQSPLTYGDYRKTPNTALQCIVRGCTNTERLNIPLYLKWKLLADYHLYVTPRAKVCREHLQVYDWSFIDNMQHITLLHISDIIEMLKMLSESEMRNQNMNFETLETISSEQFQYWIGLTKQQFINLLGQLEEFSLVNKHKTILATFLIKLRTGEPNTRLAQILNTSEPTIRRWLNLARQHLLESYTPRHLGINHLSRNDLIQRNLMIPEGLFGEQHRKAITICDGTYIYLQKSSNYLFQKDSYSLHKYRNLVKAFLMVATDGHIIDVFGPYAATMSDSDIIKQLFENSQNGLRTYFSNGDVFILDRGFRDAIQYLNSLNYVIHKPESRDEGEFQLSSIKANKSRLVTLCRWVVEVVNGRFKRDYKLFRNVYFNTAATHLMDDFKIAAAIINNYHPVLVDRPDASLILDRALQRFNLPNYLGNYIVEQNMNRRRASFTRIDGNIPQINIFPQMEMNDLILFALGIYQIKQARSYYGEHIRENGSFIIEVCNNVERAHIIPDENEAQQLIRGRIKSRHQTQKVYFTYILIKPSGNDWQSKIIGYYCNCLVGMRTVGCCAHIMTIVWYLGWARHQEIIEAPASFLDGILVRDDDDDDDENE